MAHVMLDCIAKCCSHRCASRASARRRRGLSGPASWTSACSTRSTRPRCLARARALRSTRSSSPRSTLRPPESGATLPPPPPPLYRQLWSRTQPHSGVLRRQLWAPPPHSSPTWTATSRYTSYCTKLIHMLNNLEFMQNLLSFATNLGVSTTRKTAFDELLEFLLLSVLINTKCSIQINTNVVVKMATIGTRTKNSFS